MGGRPGIAELVLVLAVLLLLFGAKRLPELARALGRSLSEFRRGRQEGEKSTGEEHPVSNDDPKNSVAHDARSNNSAPGDH
ncbi:MAG TPA: twin-arginine translocase TatA/TatE family subunit [Kiritimatiellae bacterium]|nr:twin-arginine translocase TatA/TatE family subunit [Kiritimatiellia bacterium]